MKSQTSTSGGGARKPPRTAVGVAEPRKGPSRAAIIEAIKEMSVRELIDLQGELRKALHSSRRRR